MDGREHERNSNIHRLRPTGDSLVVILHATIYALGGRSIGTREALGGGTASIFRCAISDPRVIKGGLPAGGSCAYERVRLPGLPKPIHGPR